MVTRKRLRTILNALALYVLTALLIGYFGVNAYSGNRGLKAKEDIDRQMASLNADLTRLKLEHAQWSRRVALLKSDAIDPDMLDERARLLLDYADPRDLTLMFRPAGNAATAPHPQIYAAGLDPSLDLSLDLSLSDHEIRFSDKHLADSSYPTVGDAPASAAIRIPLLEEARLPECIVIL